MSRRDYHRAYYQANAEHRRRQRVQAKQNKRRREMRDITAANAAWLFKQLVGRSRAWWVKEEWKWVR